MGGLSFMFMVVIATIATHAANMVSIRFFDAASPFYTALIASTITLPLAFLGRYFYNIYFGAGTSTLSYFSLNVMSISASVIFGFLIHQVFGSGKFHITEIVGNTFIIIGIIIVLSRSAMAS